ncbi:hypothetical protein [Natrialba aegyptia]|uniref:Uncharacterized protein n=1 Tax=Natrialba aegyptia DSM 13077 TaxID=1227491 RepID=M0BAR5_9EURY|nr:hypothetical protein [Natrialba aegyptia]ELZ07393.1 hypothetical protein C480_05036 [Natrialba aegyptia DSM 13077]
MIGEHAFCPTSGASLSRERHYDERGRPERAPEADGCSQNVALETPLTTGKRRSSKRALLTYFRRCHQRHAVPDDELYARAAVTLTRLKRTASGRGERDVIVWYALGERLARDEFAVEWMTNHVEPRCQNCGGRLTYLDGADGLIGRCGTVCTDTGRDQLAVIRHLVRSLLNRTFPTYSLSEADALTLL